MIRLHGTKMIRINPSYFLWQMESSNIVYWHHFYSIWCFLYWHHFYSIWCFLYWHHLYSIWCFLRHACRCSLKLWWWYSNQVLLWWQAILPKTVKSKIKGADRSAGLASLCWQQAKYPYREKKVMGQVMSQIQLQKTLYGSVAANTLKSSITVKGQRLQVYG